MINNFHIIGCLICIIFISIIHSNNKSGDKPAISINWYPYIRRSSLFVNDYHIHHWILAALFLLILIPVELKIKKKNPVLSIITGFLFVFMIQGLSYKDRFKL